MAGLIDTQRAQVPKQAPSKPLAPLQPAKNNTASGIPEKPIAGGNMYREPGKLAPGVTLPLAYDGRRTFSSAPVAPPIQPGMQLPGTLVEPKAEPGVSLPGALVEPAMGPGVPLAPTFAAGEPPPAAPAPAAPPPAIPDPAQTSPAPAAPPASAAAPARGASVPTWTPSEGLSENIEEGQTQDVTATSYETTDAPAANTYEAQGYTPEGYTADQVDENLSGAVDRVISKGGPLARRAEAAGLISAQTRGLLNSSMAAGASYGALLDHAVQIAQGDVDVSKFNVGQNNDALRFTADAKNSANAFLANAKNMAAQFGAGEANKMAMFAVEQANLAARFAAEAENAAKMFNADAFNQAKQKYADAVNAARAAEQDARNLAARDTATFQQQKNLQDSQNATQLAAARSSASAAVKAAQIRADVDREQLKQQGAQFDIGTKITIDQMGQSAFQQYQSGFNNLQLQEMEPEARANAISNYNAIWKGNPYLPITINTGP